MAGRGLCEWDMRLGKRYSHSWPDEEFESGLLTIHLPKTPEWKTDGRRIEISGENSE